MRDISIIIPNTNSLLIGEIIRRLKQQTVDMSLAEILIVGVDEPCLVIENDLVRFIPTEQPGYASDKRNIGMQVAQGDIFLFLDDDCLPANDWLAHHIYRHNQGELVVGGAVTFEDTHYLQLADNVSAYHDLLPFTSIGNRPYLSTANLSIRRSIVDEVGMMLPHFTRAEDLDWTVRIRKAGYKLYFDPRIVVFHKPNRYTFLDVWHHWVNDAHDTLQVRLTYPDLLGTPCLAQYRSIFLWGAPFIAIWATIRTFNYWQILQKYWYTIPLVYVTKLIWCWGAFKYFPILETKNE